MKNLKNKVAVVTGAGSGIGRALAKSLADRGCRLALSDVNESGLAETAAALSGADVKTYRLDVSDRDAIFAHAEEVVKDFGQVNLVINNAGVALSATVREMTDEDFKWVMDIDFWGVAHGTRAFLPHLIASGDGHVVNVSSVFGLIGVPKQSAYNAAKFAVRGFTEALRQEMKLENQPVAVSCVHPGGIRTNIVNAARMGKSENAVAQRKGFDKLAMTTPEKAAEIIVKASSRMSPAYWWARTPGVLMRSTACWVLLTSRWWSVSPARTSISEDSMRAAGLKLGLAVRFTNSFSGLYSEADPRKSQHEYASPF